MKKAITLFSMMLATGITGYASVLHQTDSVEIREKIEELGLSPRTVSQINDFMQQQRAEAPEAELPGTVEMRYKRVATAPKDGCFYGIGDPRNYYKSDGLTDAECAECEKNGGRVKTSQSYVWGLTKGADKLIWGSINNYFCTRAFDKIGGMEGGMPVTATDNSCYVCEFEEAASGDRYSDWHAPRIYSFDMSTNEKTDVTPADDNEALSRTLGLRSAGTIENISFVGGPNLDNKVSIFAYDNSQPVAEFQKSWALGSLPGFPARAPYNMRRWALANGELYFGVEWKDGATKETGGAVLRFRKENKHDLSDPAINDPEHFFEVVGWTRGGVAEMVFMDNHLYVTTWPSCTLCKSPAVNVKLHKVTSADDTRWQELFTYADYDPDLLCGQLGSGGAMAVYKDQIYFGTLNMPMMGVMFAAEMYGIDLSDPQQLITALLATTRGCTLFRYVPTPGEGNGYRIDLLYGESELPAFNLQTKEWEMKSTGMTPLYGKSGFGDIMNNYCWSMNVYNEKLYIGTMDWTGSIYPRLEEMLIGKVENAQQILDLLKLLGYASGQIGFDLLRIDGADQAAKVISRDGLGHQTQYGIRNMINIDGKLYLGTANPYNVHDISGWELIEMTEDAPYKELKVSWTPEDMKYGEAVSEKQLNAKVTTQLGLPVKGTYHYTVMYQSIEDAGRLTPETYNLRMTFEPEDPDTYAACSAKRTLTVAKSMLQVTGDTIEITTDGPLPDNYTYKIEGFVYEDDENVLDKKPTALCEVTEPLQEGNYDVVVSGGESKLYDFNYKNGQLLITLPLAANAALEEQFALYPVPFKDVINIKSPARVLKVSVNNIAGAEMMSIENPDQTLDLSRLPEAVYLLRIETEHGVFVRKVTKTK